jgi:hypothetical protein
MKREKLEITRAVLRLANEELIPVDTVAKEMRITRESVKRWGIRSRNGVFLDVVQKADEVWYTSRQALARFMKATNGLAERPCSMSDSESRIRLEPPQRTKRQQSPKEGEGRSYEDIMEAVRRVNAEGLVSATTLSAELGVRESELVQWITEGLDDHFLDGANLGQAGWFSSRRAVERFIEASNYDRQPTDSVEGVLVESA